jgi:ABC-type Fe3+/spermidine/putrescine transport system ATPase subunit
MVKGRSATSWGVEGLVEDRIYLGDHVKYLIRGDDGMSLIAKEPCKSATATAMRGDRVTLSWDSNDCRFVPLA